MPTDDAGERVAEVGLSFRPSDGRGYAVHRHVGETQDVLIDRYAVVTNSDARQLERLLVKAALVELRLGQPAGQGQRQSIADA